LELGQDAILAYGKIARQNPCTSAPFGFLINNDSPAFFQQWYTRIMSYELSSQSHYPPSERGPRLWVERLLLAAFLFSLLVGLSALAIFFVVRNDAQPSLNADPLQSVRTELIVPQIALRGLAGDSAAGLANQSLQAGHLETARAILTYATDIPAVERAARLTNLGRAYLAANEPEMAGQLFSLVIPVAILDDSVPVLERINLLTQSADGLHNAGFTAAAVDAATQAMYLTVQAPALLPAQRSALFTDLRTVVDAFDSQDSTANELELLLDDYGRNPYLTGAGLLITPTLAAFPQLTTYDSPTQEKLALRWQAARILADRIDFTGGVDIEPERVALAQALTAEDQARAQFYQNPGEISRGQQLWLLLDRRAWLIEKVRIALGGYGVSIVPEWEAQLNGLLAELNAANGFLNSVMAAYANDQPTELDKTLLQIETQHWLAAQMMAGLYPDAPANNISELLRSLQDDLKRQGTPLALPITYDDNATPPGFRIQPVP
jgi:hypothetical protein